MLQEQKQSVNTARVMGGPNSIYIKKTGTMCNSLTYKL